MQEKGISITSPISPKIGIPLIEQATIEDNDELRKKWANMLANAVNPEYKNAIKRGYISILSDMEPIDVLILEMIVKEYLHLSASLSVHRKGLILFDRSKISQNLKITIEECEISLRNLLRLGCLKPGVIITEGIAMGGHNPTTYKDTELIGITALGLEFYDAVN